MSLTGHSFILIWYESVFGRDKFKSKENKKFLEGLHENIQVVRHPMMVPFIYSHHQKFVVVDRKRAFVGGIDIAWGRYDDKDHPLTDEDKQLWWGVDYYNPRVASPDEFYSIETTETDYFDRHATNRMPWHDMDFAFNGRAAMDVARNFIQRWNHHRDFLDVELAMRKENMRLDVPEVRSVDDASNAAPLTSGCYVQVLRSISSWSGCDTQEDSIYRTWRPAMLLARDRVLTQ